MNEEEFAASYRAPTDEQIVALSTDLWSASIAFYAFRYTLGRQTYAVAEVGAYLTRVRDRLPAHVKRMICAEIDEAIHRGQAGAPTDIELWRSVATALRSAS